MRLGGSIGVQAPGAVPLLWQSQTWPVSELRVPELAHPTRARVCRLDDTTHTIQWDRVSRPETRSRVKQGSKGLYAKHFDCDRSTLGRVSRQDCWCILMSWERNPRIGHNQSPSELPSPCTVLVYAG